VGDRGVFFAREEGRAFAELDAVVEGGAAWLEDLCSLFLNRLFGQLRRIARRGLELTILLPTTAHE
jgi:hypothetical protein